MNAILPIIDARIARKGARWSDSEIALAIQLRRDAEKTVPEIAAALGRTTATGVFGGMPIGPLASTLGLDEAHLVTAIPVDSPLFALLARQALIERRLDLLDKFDDSNGELWRTLLTQRAAQSGVDFDLPVSDRALFVDALIAPARWRELPQAHELQQLYEFLRAPFPAAQAQALIAGKAYRDFLASTQRDDGAHHHIAVAAFTPAALRDELRGKLAPLPLASTSLALTLLSALDLIDPA